MYIIAIYRYYDNIHFLNYVRFLYSLFVIRLTWEKKKPIMFVKWYKNLHSKEKLL